MSNRGWFRAEAVDEVDGLDSKYHKKATTKRDSDLSLDQFEENGRQQNIASYGEGNRKVRMSLAEQERQAGTPALTPPPESNHLMEGNGTGAKPVPATNATSLASGGW